MAQVTITQLPAAQALTGTESVPISQNGQTVQTTTGAIANSPTQQQTFLTATNEATLPNSRQLQGSTGVGLVDTGALGTLAVTLNGVSGSLESCADGMISKSSGAVVGRTITGSVTGVAVTNGTGAGGNPVISLNGTVGTINGLSGTGIMGLVGGASVAALEIVGTASEISVANGTGPGNPTIGLADNPVIPGVEGMVLPIGSTGDRPGGAINGEARYNSTTSRFEGYQNNSWASFGSGDGTVTSVDVSGGATGLTTTGGPVTGSGTITLVGTPISATNIAGGAANKIPYQASPSNTSFVDAPVSADTFLKWDGAAFAWGTVAGAGTVTSVSGAGTVNGITLTGTVTSSGNLTLGGALSGVSLATQVTGTLPVLNGGTGATDASTARSNLSAAASGANTDITSVALTTGTISTAPSANTDIANKLYVDTAAATGVASFSAGTTGFTPNSATTGAVTLAGTLAVANGGTGITSFGAGVATFLGTPSSANLAAAVTDETGSGLLVFGTSPSLTTPAISGGTINNSVIGGNVPAAATFTNAALTTGTVATSPSGNSDIANKAYVDLMTSTSISIHTPVRLESPNTAGNLTATYVNGGTTPTWTSITGGTTLVTGSAHSLSVNDVIVFGSTTNGVTAGTAYFVYSTPSATDITLSLSYNGVEITTLTNGTGLTITSLANAGVGATLTNAGTKAALVVDGKLTVVNNRVLIYNQTNAFENGVYTVTTVGTPDPAGTNWVLTRATDADTYGPNSTVALGQGDYFFVQEGDTGAGESYVMTTAGTIIFGTTSLTFTQFGASQVYSAGTGLTLTNTTFSITNTTVTPASYGLAASVPTIAVNAQGQITSAVDTAIAIAASQVTSGTLAIAQGGTNSNATATAGGSAYGTGTAFAFTAAGTAGQVLTSAGASAPTWSGISGGTFS